MKDYVPQEFRDCSFVQYQGSALAISYSQIRKQINNRRKSHLILKLVILDPLKLNLNFAQCLSLLNSVFRAVAK